MGNFIESLMEFLGLKKPEKRKAQEKEPVESLSTDWLPPIPSITPKTGRAGFKRKEPVKPRQAARKKTAFRPASSSRHSKKAGIPFQFEVEKVLKEAIALKKKLDKSKKAGKIQKRRAGKKRSGTAGKKLKQLTFQEIEEFRKRLKSSKMLSDFEIGRLKEHLKKGVEIPEGKIPVLISESQLAQPSQKIPEKPIQPQETLGDQIKNTEELLKRLEIDFLKRRISEQEYRQRALDLKQKLNELRIKKKRELENAGERIPAEISGFSRQGREKNEGRIEELNGKVKDLMKRSNIPESSVQVEISKIDKSKLFGNADKVVDLIELEQKTQKLMQEHLELEKQKKQSAEKTDFGTGFEAGVPLKKKEEVKEVIIELEKHRIITDFDKLLELIQKNGRLTANDALKELKISKQRLNECLEVLEENKLITVEFPPIGPAMIFDINYQAPVVKAKGKKGVED